MTGISTPLHSTSVLDDALNRAPSIAAELSEFARTRIAWSGGTLTDGIPRTTWNGLDDLGRLEPGIHPATAAELELRFAWNDHRAALYATMHRSLAGLRFEHPDLRHVVGGGSFFSGKPNPGDVDLALLAREPDLAATRVHNRRDPWVHVYPAEGHSNGIPQYSVEFFRFETGHSARGTTERGLVLFDLDDLL